MFTLTVFFFFFKKKRIIGIAYSLGLTLLQTGGVKIKLFRGFNYLLVLDLNERQGLKPVHFTGHGC